MTKNKEIWLWFTFLLCWHQTVAQPAASLPLTPQELRGKQIFLNGKSDSNTPVVAVLRGTEVPASALPCGSCHGSQGKGNAEGGVQPSDIRWETLTRHYPSNNQSRREHPAYDQKTVKKAIALGLDPAGNSLSPMMPRYSMSMTDMADLVAYIKCLGSDQDEGLTKDELKIACLLPPGGIDKAPAKTVSALIRARFDQVNKSGGIYGRKVTCTFFSETPGADSAVEMLRKEHPFALGCSFWPPNNKALLDYLQQEGIPVCAAIAETTTLGPSHRSNIFFLYAGLEEQLQALLELSKASGPASIVCPDTPEDRALVARLQSVNYIARNAAIVFWKAGSSPKDIGAAVARKKTGAVVFLGGCELLDLLNAFEENAFSPMVFAPGARAGKQLFSAPLSFHKRVVLAFPTWVDQVTDQGLHRFRELQREYDLAPDAQNIQMICLAATDLLIDKLKGCGQELSREKLTKVLENGETVKNGLIPDISFHPNKRVGSTEVFLLELDVANKSLVRTDY